MCCFNCPFILELNYMCAPILGARRTEIQTPPLGNNTRACSKPAQKAIAISYAPTWKMSLLSLTGALELYQKGCKFNLHA